MQSTKSGQPALYHSASRTNEANRTQIEANWHFHGWLSFSRVEPAGVLMREPMLHKKGTHFCRHLPSDFGIYGGL